MSRSVNLHLMASKSGCSNPPINPHAAEAVDPQAAVECGCRLRDGFDRESWEPAVEPGWEGPGACGRPKSSSTAGMRMLRMTIALLGSARETSPANSKARRTQRAERNTSATCKPLSAKRSSGRLSSPSGRWVPRQTAATARERDRRVSDRLKGALRRVVAPPRPKPEPAVEGELGRPADVAVADTTIAKLLARVRDHRRADAATAGRLGHTDGADRSAVVA